MYFTTLFIHSWLRWVVLILAIWVIIRSLSAWLGKKDYLASDNRLAIFFIAFMHLQLVIGLILYFVYSPMGLAAFQQGMGSVMKNGAVRYWAVEHIFTMVVAVVLAQIGRTRSKRAVNPIAKHKNLAIFTILALLLILSRIPWETARLFRLS
ncbi:MAG: hypothetical protein NW226_20830 [Microscillaceae bacterium]|nr:hypothetical protein [Microscillaceae bacterium]